MFDTTPDAHSQTHTTTDTHAHVHTHPHTQTQPARPHQHSHSHSHTHPHPRSHATPLRFDTKQYYIPHTRNRGYLLAIRDDIAGVPDDLQTAFCEGMEGLERPATVCARALITIAIRTPHNPFTLTAFCSPASTEQGPPTRFWPQATPSPHPPDPQRSLEAFLFPPSHHGMKAARKNQQKTAKRKEGQAVADWARCELIHAR